MNSLKTLIVLFVSICFISAFGSTALGAPPLVEKKQKEIISPPSTPTITLCPAGWKKKPGSGSEIRCVPKKPAPMNCPKGYKYYEKLTCTIVGPGCNADGCEVGCFKPPEPPK